MIRRPLVPTGLATMPLRCLPFLVAAVLLAPSPAPAAESFDGCANRTIASLPATITTAGRWCLAGDLATAMASGAAISIAVNNVVLDCNGFRLAGTATADTAQATGVLVVGRNATVHGCRISGFHTGLKVVGDAAIVADNTVSNSSRVGIHVAGDGGAVRGNSVVDTGDDADVVTSSPRLTAGIVADGSVDVIDNLVANVRNRGSHADERAYAVRLANARGGVVRGNRLRTVSRFGAYPAHSAAVRVGPNSAGIAVDGNDITLAGAGVVCTTPSAAILRGNTLQDSGTTLHLGCVDGGGNAAPVVE